MVNWGKVAKNVAGDIADSSLSAAKKLARTNAVTKVSKQLTDIGGDLSKFDLRVLKNADGTINPDAVSALKGLLQKGGKLSSKESKNLAKKMSELAPNATGKQIQELVDTTIGEAGDALKKAETFFDKNKNLLMAAGLTTVGIAMVMLLVNNKSPAAVAGIPKEDLAPDSTDGIDDEDEGDEDEDGGGGGGNRKKRVFEAFLKDWGTYIIIFIVILIIIGVGAYFLSRGSKDTTNALPENAA
jgi:hypothetical protein